ncbi:MAG TPA: CAP domain-containing protein [Urbifossiella sp.]|nr:CAP domain-containing protein [Urbifossiella sp.]
MPRSLSLAAALLAGAAVAQPADPPEVVRVAVPDVPDDSGKRPDLADVAKRIADRATAFRKEHGRAALATDAKLTAAAGYFASHMAARDEYGHTADGNQPADRVKRHGYVFCLVLENIAHAYDSRGYDAGPLADTFAGGWEESPGHRKNLLDPDATDIGVAVARSARTGHYYAVQLFGRPKAAAVVFAVENRAGEAVRYTIGREAFDLPPRVPLTHTRCRPADLTFTWPDGKTATVRPAAGDRWVVTKDGDGFAAGKAK